MRKYHQVALLALALVSVFGLLVYRKQYVELRSTFENFNIFGVPEKSPECVVLNETLNIRDINFSYPLSRWATLQDGFHVYSAFWKDEGISKAVGIGPKGSIPKFECHIWHEYKDSLFSSVGTFSFMEVVVENSSSNVFEFSCDVGSKDIQGTPYMFVFVRNNNNKRMIPIVNGKTFRSKDSVAMCIYPEFTGSSKSSIIEFIAYHQVIGFTDFIVYDEIHYGLLLKVKNFASALGWINSFDILPWQFPLELNDPASKAVIDIDCIHRVSKKASLIAIIHFEDYIVPTYHKKIEHIINKTDSAILKLSYQTCCIDFKSDRLAQKSWPLILRKTYCVANSQNRRILVYPQEDTLNSLSIASLAVIKSYRTCSPHEKSKVTYDSSLRKFLAELLHSKILLLWNSGSFFQKKF